MAPGDIGVSCGMIAHVEDKRDIIVKTLNSKPESWIEFYAYNNNLAQPWIEQAYAQHQNTILQQHVCPDSFSLRKSKIWPLAKKITLNADISSIAMKT